VVEAVPGAERAELVAGDKTPAALVFDDHADAVGVGIAGHHEVGADGLGQGHGAVHGLRHLRVRRREGHVGETPVELGLGGL
jgi:hypothetical protein